MPEYLAPGVFVEEIDSGSKPIEGVGINTAAFIGYAKSGDFNTPTFISSWSDFCRIFGEEDDVLLKPLADELGRAPIQLLTQKRAARPTMSWAEFADREFKKRGGSDGQAKSWPEFLKKHDLKLVGSPYIEGTYLAYAVRGFFDNGGGRAYIIRVARDPDLKLLNYAPSARALEPAKSATTEIDGISFKALQAGEAGNSIKVEVVHEKDGFTVTVRQDDKTETFGSDAKPLTPDQVQSAVSKSRIVLVESVKTETRPKAGTFTLSGGANAVDAGSNLLALPLKQQLDQVSPEDFVGDETKRSGFSGLSLIEDINMIAIPDLMAGVYERPEVGGEVVDEMVTLSSNRKSQILAIQKGLIDYCERMGDRIAILDPLPALSPQEVRSVVIDEAKLAADHGQATIYYPWVKVIDQIKRGRNGERFQTFVPPCGHVAGVWARVGVERGVHKAPANETLMGAVTLEKEITKGEQEILNPVGINCIRAFPGTGIRIWGARTLATYGNPSWKYVNVRRLFNYLEKSMERGMQWVVFEPNDHDLWDRVRRNLSAFLWTEWKEGKLFGATPEEAYYVKCDRETNPQEMIDLGRLYVEIGVNPVKPAEFVIVRIGQWSGGGERSEA